MQGDFWLSIPLCLLPVIKPASDSFITLTPGAAKAENQEASILDLLALQISGAIARPRAWGIGEGPAASDGGLPC
jgi:hypothetical protein